MKIKHKEFESEGSFTAFKDEEKAGEMTYSIAGEDKWIINHTGVNPAYRGQGVGEALLDDLVKLARERNKKVLPLCPFASSVFQKREDIRDVLN